MALPQGNLTAMSRRPGTPCRTLAAVKGGLRQLDSANVVAGRRGLVSSILLSTTATLMVPTTSEDSKSALLQEYLRRSKENKEKNDKERLDDYYKYKRNYKDYFEFVEGSDQGKELSESEKGIREWLRKNRK